MKSQHTQCVTTNFGILIEQGVAEKREDTSNVQSPQLMSNYHTSSEMIKATVGGVPAHNYRAYGVPTIRSDLPAPRIRRVSDHTVSSVAVMLGYMHRCSPDEYHTYATFSLSLPLRIMVMSQTPMV